MSGQSFLELVEATEQCNKELYRCCKEGLWEVSTGYLDTRNKLLQQLEFLAPSLTQSEIDILAALYQNTLESDKIYLNNAESEQTQVKKQLRQIKRAQTKALPAYRNNS